jgi:hypothetical protein
MQEAASLFYPWLVSAIGGFLGALFLLPTRLAEFALKHSFDRLLESYKGPQLQVLEQFKHELKSRDEQIASIRTLALSGLATRTEVLTRRKIQAAEVVWASVMEYKRYRHVVEMVGSIKLKEAMEHASQEGEEGEKVRRFAATIIDTMKIENLKFEASPDREQIFVNADVWARFALFRSVMTLPISKLLAMRGGMKPSIIKSQAPLLLAAKSVLPHMTSFIDEYGEEGLSYLYDLFEEEVLKAIVAGFSDTAADAAGIRQAAFIIENVNKANFELQNNVELEVPSPLARTPRSAPTPSDPSAAGKGRSKLIKYIPKDG